METEDEAIATTFFCEETIEVVILAGPSPTGLCKVQRREPNTSPFARHVDRLTPVNDTAKKRLGK